MSDPIAAGETEGRDLVPLPASLTADADVWFMGHPHPFKSDRVQRGFSARTTIAEMLEQAGFAPQLRPFVQVYIASEVAGGEAVPIPREFWHQVRPKAGTFVYARVVPGKKGKNPLGIVLSLAFMAAAAYLSAGTASALGGGLFGKIAGAVVGAAVSMVGAPIGPALLPPPRGRQA